MKDTIFFHGNAHAALGVAFGDKFCRCFGLIGAVFHGKGPAGPGKHLQVVVRVAKGHDLGGVEPKLIRKGRQGAALVNAAGGELQVGLDAPVTSRGPVDNSSFTTAARLSAST